MYQELFSYMSNEHGITLLENEMQEIIRLIKIENGNVGAETDRSPIHRKLSMKDILMNSAHREAKVGIQYADYSPNEWTLPYKLTQDKVTELLEDGSIRKIRLEFEL